MKSLVTIRDGGAAHWAIRIAAALLVVAALFLVPTKGGNGLITSSTEALTLMCAAMALNLLLGYTGQISIGHSAFFGIGAYTTGICVSRWGWSPWITFPLAFVAAFVVGVIVSFPASRIKGVYLALVTLALALVFPNVLRWPKLAWLTGGGPGLPNKDSQVQTTGFDIGRKPGQMRHFEIFGWDPFGDLRSLDAKTAFYYWIAAFIAVVVYLVCRGVVKSRAGRAMVAVRDNETAAAVMGVNVVATKAFVFGISAGLCALPGSVTAIRIGSVSPDIASLTIIGSLTFLIVMVIGGAGSLWGPIVGACLYVFISDKTGTWANDDAIPALLRPFFAWSKTPPGGGIFAVLLIALMFVAPRGIVGAWKQYSSRLVRVVPRPVGMTAPEALVRESGADTTDTTGATGATNINNT
ncbi:MAG: branched-chain amino acid ABC transporter permease [Ilumatobacteraceae bacterium]